MRVVETEAMVRSPLYNWPYQDAGTDIEAEVDIRVYHHTRSYTEDMVDVSLGDTHKLTYGRNRSVTMLAGMSENREDT